MIESCLFTSFQNLSSFQKKFFFDVFTSFRNSAKFVFFKSLKKGPEENTVQKIPRNIQFWIKE